MGVSIPLQSVPTLSVWEGGPDVTGVGAGAPTTVTTPGKTHLYKAIYVGL